MNGWQVSVGSFNVDFDMMRRMADLNRVLDVVPGLESPLVYIFQTSRFDA